MKKFANDVEFFDVEMRVGENFIFQLPAFVIKHSVWLNEINPNLDCLTRVSVLQDCLYFLPTF